MPVLTYATTEAQLTDDKGWVYRDSENRPLSLIPQLMNIIYQADLGEDIELDWIDSLRFAVYLDNVASYGEDLTNDRLAEYWEQCEEAYAGSHASEGEFARDYLAEIGDYDEEKNSLLVIDWEATYHRSFSGDFWNCYIYARNEEMREFEAVRFFFRSY